MVLDPSPVKQLSPIHVCKIGLICGWINFMPPLSCVLKTLLSNSRAALKLAKEVYV